MTWDEADVAAARERLVAVAAHLPGVETADDHGHTGFELRGKRIGWLLAGHHGDGRLALWVKAPAGEQDALVSGDPGRYFVPPYLGHRGWVGALVDRASDPDWPEITALLEQAWRMTAGKRAITAYDATH